MRESSTGAETDTSPKGGESIRSSKLSEDLAKRTRKWPTEQVYWNLTVYGRTPGLVVFHWLRPRSTVDRSSITSFVIQSSEVYFVGRASHGAHYTTMHSRSYCMLNMQ